MLNLGELTYDPDFAQGFTITRRPGHFGAGGWVMDTPQSISAVGIIQPAKEEELQQVPEGDRVSGAMSFISATQMLHTGADDSRGTDGHVSDLIEWRGQKYRVAGVWPWADFGFWKAIGVRVSGL